MQTTAMIVDVKRTGVDETKAWRTATAAVRLSPADYRHAHDACHRAGLFWNVAVNELRLFWAAHHRDPQTTELRRLCYSAAADAGLMGLHSHTRSIIVDGVLDAVDTYRSNRKAGVKTRGPWRFKQYRPIAFTAGNGWRERDGRIILSGGRGQPSITFATPTITDHTGAVVKPDEWGQGELCWDRENRRWEWHVAYLITAPPRLNPDRILALDPGIINSFTTAHETDTTYEITVISGRAGRAIKHRRNTAVAEIVRKQSRCTKGSRQWRKYEAARKRISGKGSDALRNFDHHVARHVATIAQAGDTGNVIVGDVRGIERNTLKTDKRRFGRNQRRRLSQWSRGRQERYIAEKIGVKQIAHQDEAYSSKTCPACRTRNRPSGRNYHCGCGFVCHRDGVGALNQLQKALHGTYVPIDPNKAVVVRYRRALPGTRRTHPDPVHVACCSTDHPSLTPTGRESTLLAVGSTGTADKKPRP